MENHLYLTSESFEVVEIARFVSTAAMMAVFIVVPIAVIKVSTNTTYWLLVKSR
jgi:hypothetical protein